MSVALIPPLLLITTLVVKNGIQHGIYAPTSGAGQNIIQNLNLALVSANNTGALELAEKLNYPNWWIWCYREAERLQHWTQKNISGFYGTCNRGKKGYEFERLKKYLANTGNLEILRIVEEDEKIVARKPWLLAGQVGSRSTKFSAIYGKISSKLLLDVATLFPRNYAGRTYLNFTYLIQNGPRFEIDYANVSERLPGILNKLSTLLAPILRTGMYLAYALVLAVPCWFLIGFFKLWKIPKPTAPDGIVWILCIGFSFGTLANVAVHCCESYRHAFPFMPLIVIIMVYFGYRVAVAFSSNIAK